MGYAKKLTKQFTGLSELTGGELQRKRDALNRAGVFVKPVTHDKPISATYGSKTDVSINRYYAAKNSSF